jgi:hypothetical protein
MFGYEDIKFTEKETEGRNDIILRHRPASLNRFKQK